MKKELSKIYNPENLEEKWFKTWNDGGYFEPAGACRTDCGGYCVAVPQVQERDGLFCWLGGDCWDDGIETDCRVYHGDDGVRRFCSDSIKG